MSKSRITGLVVFINWMEFDAGWVKNYQIKKSMNAGCGMQSWVGVGFMI